MKCNITSKRPDLDNRALHLPSDYAWKVLAALHSDLRKFLAGPDGDLLDQIIRSRDFESLQILSKDWGLQRIAFSEQPLMQIRAMYQLASLIKKFQFPTSKKERRSKAISKMLLAEQQCKEFNEEGWKRLLKPGDDEWQMLFFANVKSTLVKILGEELPSIKKFLPWSRHGPGANLDTSEDKVSTYHKYENWPYSCTKGAFRYARFMIETDQRWYGALQNSYRERKCIPMHYPLDMKRFWTDVIVFVDHNRITTVPKDALTDRSIAIEPALNVMLQLGVDGYIRRRLLRFGVNLNSQRHNQVLARKGSIDGSFSTIDLAAASDTMSLKLCKLVLPKPWYDYLVDLRCPVGISETDNLEINYSKISSMGNGYTFVLESALFAAITFAAIEADGSSVHYDSIAIFGDDIIVPTRHYPSVIRGLFLCGFKTNVDKTFISGYVRESCGTDWYQGFPLRPVFLTKPPSDTTGLFNDYNRLRRVLSMYWGIGDESSALLRIYRWIPVHHRNIIGPVSDTEFDGYLHCESDFRPGNRYELWDSEFQCIRYTRLYQKAIRVSAPDFFYRKMMHDLRGMGGLNSPDLMSWKILPIAGKSSSRFAVSRKREMVGRTSSYASFWNSEYDDLAYIKLR